MAASIVLLSWASLCSAATIGPGAVGAGLPVSLATLQRSTGWQGTSLRALGGRGRTAVRDGAAAQPRRVHGHAAQPVLTRPCLPCLVGVARPRVHPRGPIATEREERERLAPAQPQPRPRAGRRPASARAVPSTQLQASRSGGSDLRGASARQEIPHSAPLLRAPPFRLG